MVRRTHVQLTDDLDGGEASQTVAFALGNTHYEIDLSDKNAAKLAKALAPYVADGRKAREPARRGAEPSSASSGDAHVMRAWAREHGYEVSERGRIPRDVVLAYNAS